MLTLNREQRNLKFADPAKAAAQREIYRRRRISFFRDELKIHTKDGKLVPLIPNTAQRIYLNTIRQQRKQGLPPRLICLKARQVGFSTISQAVIYADTSLNPYRRSLVLAHDSDTSEIIFQMSNRFHMHQTPNLRPEKRFSSKRDLLFEGASEKQRLVNPGLSSSITVQTAGNKHSGSAQTIHNAHLSEVARYPNPEELRKSLFPSVPTTINSLIVMESTAHTICKFFHSEWDRAVAGESSFAPIFVPWHMMVEYALPIPHGTTFNLTKEERLIRKTFNVTREQLWWRRRQIKDFDSKHDFHQEYPMTPEEAWRTANTPVFNQTHLRRLYSTIEEPKFIGDLVNGELFPSPEGNLRIYRQPHPDRYYDIGADVALGDPSTPNGDYSYAPVIERGSYDLVAEWHGHIEPLQFAYILASLGEHYNTAQIGVETNAQGYATHAALSHIYPNLYLTRKRDDKRSGSQITNKTGWKTDPKSKPYMISIAKHLMSRQEFPQICSSALWSELDNYIDYGDGEYGAAYKHHDDRVMGWMIALVISNDEDWEFYEGESSEPEELEETHDPAYCDAENPFNNGQFAGSLAEPNGWESM